jgi:hypothetical protein
MRNRSRSALLSLSLAVALVGCATTEQSTEPKDGSWFWKPKAFSEDVTSRRLLTGMWRSESTDLHAARRIEESTRNADGTYETHFKEIDESGKVTMEQTECGRWGISGDVYFTITLAIREGERGNLTSPYDASYYDAYRIRKLTDKTFTYQHVVSGQLSNESKVGPAPRRALRGETAGSSPCVGVST